MTEPRYAIRNTYTNKVAHVPLTAYADMIAAKAPGSGRRIWEAMGPVPGVLTKTNGEFEQVMVPKDRQIDATFDGSAYSILRGKDDPRWEVARRDAVIEGERETAKDRGWEVAADSALSLVTGGLSSYVGNRLAGDTDTDHYAAEARQRSIQYNPGKHTIGRVGGFALALALPIPGLQAGMRGAFGIANAGTIGELGVTASSLARGAITSAFAKEAGSTSLGIIGSMSRRLAGTVAFGAVVEAPISLLLASADLVDNNKPWSGQAVVADGLVNYAWANAINLAWSLPLTAAGAALQGAGRLTLTAGSKAPTGGMMDSIMRGPARWATRRYLRGKYHGLGDIGEIQVGKEITKFQKAAREGMVDHSVGRWLIGDEGIDAVRRTRTYQQAFDHAAAASSKQSLEEALDVLSYNVKGDIPLANQLAFYKENAKRIVNARRIAHRLAKEGLEFADDASGLVYRLPRKLKGGPSMILGKQDVHANLGSGYALAASRLPKGHPMAVELQKLAASKTGSYVDALDNAMNLRMKVPKGTARDAIDASIFRSVAPEYAGEDGIIPLMFRNMDDIEEAISVVRKIAPQLQKAEGLKVHDGLLETRAGIKAIEGRYRRIINRKVNGARSEAFTEKWFEPGKKQPYFKMNTHLDDYVDDFRVMGELNTDLKRLVADPSPFSRGKVPMTREEILSAQVETIITHKKRVKEAFNYIASKGGGIRHTIAYTGVMAFRNMASLEEKRTSFAVHRAMLLEAGATPEVMQESVGKAVGPAAAFDMELGVAMADSMVRANAYLLEQMPKSDDPTIMPWDFSSAEIENWFEALGAVTDPISPLYAAADGSVTIQSVDALRTVYPDLYVDMVLDVAEFVEEHGDKLGRAQMIGLDIFTGGALGYEDAPGPALSFSLPGYQTSQQAASVGAVGGPEHRRMDYKQTATAAEKVGGL